MLREKEKDARLCEGSVSLKHFDEMAFPYVGCTVNVDVTNLLEKVKEQGADFFLAVLYYVMSAANEVPVFRRRIIDGELWEFDRCESSHTITREDFTSATCNLDYNYEIDDFLCYAQKEQQKAKDNGVNEEAEDITSLIYISTKSLLSRFSLLTSLDKETMTNPRITLGRYVEDEETKKAVMPISVLCHSAIVEDANIKAFYKKLRSLLSQVSLKVAA